jgi:hypothetical protein
MATRSANTLLLNNDIYIPAKIMAAFSNVTKQKEYV